MDSAPMPPSQTRSSSGTSRPHGSRSTNPDKQISQIEKSVTHLLVATKQLLETLTQWSRGNAQEEVVSDVYVRLGYEFNLACRAFNSIGVDTTDLGPVPDLLRSILEDTLSQPASPQSLDNYLPRIRDIIINLLQGLKRKQSKLRNRSSKDGSSKAAAPPRQTSIASGASSDTGAPSIVETRSTPPSSVRSDSRLEATKPSEDRDWVAANSSAGQLNRSSSTFNRQSTRSQERQISPTVQQPISIPQIAPPIQEPDEISPSRESTFPHPPPPPPKQDALTALQRGGDLERRASRRFSTYRISKHLGASPNGLPVIPPAQNSPIPNRGREFKEGMSAVRSRTSNASTRQKPTSRLTESVTASPATTYSHDRISEEDESSQGTIQSPPKIDYPQHGGEEDYSPTVKTPEEFERGQLGMSPMSAGPTLGPTVSGPLSPPPQTFMSQSTESLNASVAPETPRIDTALGTTTEPTPVEVAVTPQQLLPEGNADVSPASTKDLTLFLQYKSRIKKFVLAEGYDELTIARLQLAFIEKFNWHTYNNGVDLPEIYIQDPVSGVRHELEDLADVKDRSVLVLNVEVLDEVKKHFDEGIGGLKTTLDGVRSLLDGQGSLMQRFSDRQLEASKEMARLSALPAPMPTRTPMTPVIGTDAPSSSEASVAEIQNLRRDIAVMRQTYATMSSDFAAAIGDIRAKAENVKVVAAQAVAPSYEGDAGRAHVNQGKKTLNTESEALVNRVDDLSDVVEDLRKDVVTRGVRPLPRQLEDVSREITATAKDLMKMKEFLKREKPIWTKIWEQELNLVCTERDDLTQQEDLMADLDGDIEDVTEVFKLVEEAMKQQNLQGPSQASLRSTSKPLDIDPNLDPRQAKDGMLDEVRALQPNHEDRLEAIERAEKARLKELESRKEGEFQREVANFVEEGKLRKTGGMEEVERLRKIKDDRARKENFETQQKMLVEREKKRAEAAARKAAAAAEAAAAPPPALPPPSPLAATDASVPMVNGHEADVSTVRESDGTHTEIAGAESPTKAEFEPTREIVVNEPDFEDASESLNRSDSPSDPVDVITPQALQPVHSPVVATFPEATTDNVVAEPKEDGIEEKVVENTAPTSAQSINVEHSETKDPATADSANSDRQSWWKPAIFSP